MLEDKEMVDTNSASFSAESGSEADDTGEPAAKRVKIDEDDQGGSVSKATPVDRADMDAAIAFSEAWNAETRASRVRYERAPYIIAFTWHDSETTTDPARKGIRYALYGWSERLRGPAPAELGGLPVEQFSTVNPRGGGRDTFRPDCVDPIFYDDDELTAVKAAITAHRDMFLGFRNMTKLGPSCVRWSVRDHDGYPAPGTCIALTVLHPGIRMEHDGPFPKTVEHGGRVFDVDIRQGSVSLF